MANSPMFNDSVRLHGTTYVGRLLDMNLPNGMAFVCWDKSVPGYNEHPISGLCSYAQLVRLDDARNVRQEVSS